MNPSRYQIPNLCTGDRRRARRVTVALERAKYDFEADALRGHPAPGFQLPPHILDFPRDAEFKLPMKGQLFITKFSARLNSRIVKLRQLDWRLTTLADYRRLYRIIVAPQATMERWVQDEEFGRQRLTGCNPMSIRRCRERPPDALWKAAERVLRERDGAAISTVFDQRRLFYTEYGWNWDSRVQRQLAPGTTLAAPTCLFWLDDQGRMMPLAIQLKPPGEPMNPVITPLDGPYDWLLARAHAQSADAHYHEGIYHLLETHLVNETLAIALYRNLHPDHPLRQLLGPHFAFTLAINETARGNLLSPGGPIDTGMAAGVGGIMDLIRIAYQPDRWQFPERALCRDLAERGFGPDDPPVPGYLYREDGLRIWDAIADYVEAMVHHIYGVSRHISDLPPDRLVAEDYELQGWLAEAAAPEGGAIPGFPSSVGSTDELIALLTHLIFRCGPQHAAVNNGQYDNYGWLPNAPGSVFSSLPGQAPPPGGAVSADDFWKAIPNRDRALAQMGMVRVLSTPTTRTLLQSGRVPAFDPDLDFAAGEHVRAFRDRLLQISRCIQRRNEAIRAQNQAIGRYAGVPYLYLDPLNISESTDI